MTNPEHAVTKIWLTRTQARALVDFAYRGRSDRRALSAATKALEDPAERIGRLQINLTDRDRAILEEAAGTGCRIPRLTEAVQPLLRALDDAPTLPRKAKGGTPASVVEGKRRCIRCGQSKPIESFEVPDGDLCKRRRTYGNLGDRSESSAVRFRASAAGGDHQVSPLPPELPSRASSVGRGADELLRVRSTLASRKI